MVEALQKTRIAIAGQEHDAYYWVRIHTSVEADHFDAALKGVNNAARYYAGSADPAKVKDALRDTISLVDKMAKKKLIHRNAAGRYKSRLASRVAKKSAAA